MKGFALAAVVGVRQLLALIIAVMAIAGAAYLSSHKLDRHGDYAYGSCPPHFGTTLISRSGPLCGPPTRGAWQIPLALLIGAVGLGAAILVMPKRPWRRVEALYDHGDAFRIASR